MRRISIEQRRQAMVRRHHLRGDASGPDEVTAAMIALHATDPASVYLSVLARSTRSSLADVSAAIYERKSLVRWMAMRRTLFVFSTSEVPVIHAAVSTQLAAVLHRQLVSRIRRNGTVPAIDTDPDEWLSDVRQQVERTLLRLGAATGTELSAEIPALRTTVRSGAPSERPQKITSPLLTVMATDGRIVRGPATGPWTSRHHRWEPVERWWPKGLPELERSEAQRILALRWLERFGPATVADLQWWTGWNKTTVRQALGTVHVDEVDLHGEPGIALRVEDEASDTVEEAPVVTLLPALDPTPMGWRYREWFLDVDPRQIFDTAGNIGPTVWWNGTVVGSWAVAETGEVRTVIVSDQGGAATAAVETAAARLQQRLDGAGVTPAARTPLERSIA